jgi:hypothetical protein
LPDRITRWPETLNEAVDRLLSELSEADKAKIKSMEKEDLWDVHFSLGLSIRNRFGLHAGNRKLMESCARQLHPNDPKPTFAFHEDDASSVIVEALWERLQR